jgi:indolepyruvate ferredoxin oxidoreductase
VQRELREIKGVSVLIYDQTCAAEKRRRRKRGRSPIPRKRVFINEAVCEGCGDCSAEEQLRRVLPKETEFGRKREIDQSNCNKDFSCVNGFCPSFVTVDGGVPAQGPRSSRCDAAIPWPRCRCRRSAAPCRSLWNILITGVGGTGVVTIGALIGMAAHLEGKGCTRARP